MLDIIQGWRFDPFSAVITVIILPLLLYLAKIILTALKVWGGYLLEAGIYFGARLFRHSLAGAVTLKHYARLQLSSQNQYLYVPSRLDVRLPIDQVFVALNMETQGANGTNYSQNDPLEESNRIVVVGDPGSGKSSLVKWLFRDACRRAIKQPSVAHLPVLIELKNLTIPPEFQGSSSGQWLYHQLAVETSRAKVYKMDECFESYVETSGILVLLDGLDEVSTFDYQRVESAILELSRLLAQSSANNKIILTTRLQFYQQVREAYRADFSSSMFLRPFSPSDIYEFLIRWPSINDQEAERLFKELTDRPTLREMCRNPLILSMYVAEDQASGSSPSPETRTHFYQKVTEELLIKRRLHQKKDVVLAAPKLQEQRERILGRIALLHLLDKEQPANLLSWAAALSIVRDVMGCTESEAEIFFRELAKETGLITEERLGHTFRFIHLTFCEFLAANESVQGAEDGWEELIAAHEQFVCLNEPHLRSRLIEVIPFAAGLLSRSRRYSAVGQVAELADDRLLARTFLETKLYEHDSWNEFLARQEQALLNADEEHWNEEWLQDVYLFNVVISDATHCALHFPRIRVSVSSSSFFSSLVERQKESLGQILYAYSMHDAAAAFRMAEVCGIDMASDYPEIVVASCDQKPFFDLIRGQTLRGDHAERDKRSLWCSLLAEAALRSLIVSQWVDEAECSPVLASDLTFIPREKKWWREGMVKDSFLAQCLSLGVHHRDLKLPLLEAIRKVEPPGSASWIYTNAAVVINLLLIAVPSCIFFVHYFSFGLVVPKEEAWHFRLDAISLLVVISVPYFFILRAMLVRRAYRDLMQWELPPSDISLRIFNDEPSPANPTSRLSGGSRLWAICRFEFERREFLNLNNHNPWEL